MNLELLRRISDYEWIFPRNNNLLVDIHLYGNRPVVEQMDQAVLETLKLVASQPGIIDKVIALPNASFDHTFPSGIVYAFDQKEGSVLLSALNSGLNSGIRSITTNLILQDVDKRMKSVIGQLSEAIPMGKNTRGLTKPSSSEIQDLLTLGTKWAIKNHIEKGNLDELSYIENKGQIPDADPSLLTDEEIQIARQEFGSLGSQDHFLKIQYIDEIYDIERARNFGLFKNQIIFSLHTGTLSLGEMVLNRYKKLLSPLLSQNLLEKQKLSTLPFQHPEVQKMFQALSAVSNYAYANRQILAQHLISTFENIIRDIETHILYDTNIDSITQKEYVIGNQKKKLLIHRKGAVTNFSGSFGDLPQSHQTTGQPVLVDNGIGNPSYILAGTRNSMQMSFGSTISSSGRTLSTAEAKKRFSYEQIKNELKRNVFLQTGNPESVIENTQHAFKEPWKIVESTSKSGLSVRVARLHPLGILKG